MCSPAIRWARSRCGEVRMRRFGPRERQACDHEHGHDCNGNQRERKVASMPLGKCRLKHRIR